MPTVDPYILRAVKNEYAPYDTALHFALADSPYPVVVAETPDGNTHFEIWDHGRALQFVTDEDISVTEEFRLSFLIDAASRLLPQIRALERFSSLVRFHKFTKKVFPPLAASQRLSESLYALDLWLEGVSQFEIAKEILGDSEAKSAWDSPSDYAKSRIKRTLKRGKMLMNGGYLTYLKTGKFPK